MTVTAAREQHEIEAEALLSSLPMIDDTDDIADQSCDWPEARYTCTIEPNPADMSGVLWVVKHSLSAAPGLNDLLTTGDAAYAVELICAQTMTTQLHTTPPGDTQTLIRGQPDDAPGEIWLHPGVITINTCSLDPAGTAWANGNPITIPAGRWLARAAPLRQVTEAYDPLVFRPLDNPTPEHKITIRWEPNSDDIQCVISARQDRIDTILAAGDAAKLACWATALALLPQLSECELHTDPVTGRRTAQNSKCATIIARILEDDDIELWCDDDGETNPNWDPLAAAAVWFPLAAHNPTPDDETDD